MPRFWGAHRETVHVRSEQADTSGRFWMHPDRLRRNPKRCVALVRGSRKFYFNEWRLLKVRSDRNVSFANKAPLAIGKGLRAVFLNKLMGHLVICGNPFNRLSSGRCRNRDQRL